MIILDLHTRWRASVTSTEDRFSLIEKRLSVERTLTYPLSSSGFSQQNKARLKSPLVDSVDISLYADKRMSLFSIDSIVSIASFRPTIAVRIAAVDSASCINQWVLARAISKIKVISMYRETKKEGLTDLSCSKCESKAITKAEVKPRAAEAMEMAGATVLLERHHRQRSASCRLAYAAIETYPSLAHVDAWNFTREALYQLEGMEDSSRSKLYVLTAQLHQPERCDYEDQCCWTDRHHTLLKEDCITMTPVS